MSDCSPPMDVDATLSLPPDQQSGSAVAAQAGGGLHARREHKQRTAFAALAHCGVPPL